MKLGGSGRLVPGRLVHWCTGCAACTQEPPEALEDPCRASLAEHGCLDTLGAAALTPLGPLPPPPQVVPGVALKAEHLDEQGPDGRLTTLLEGQVGRRGVCGGVCFWGVWVLR